MDKGGKGNMEDKKKGKKLKLYGVKKIEFRPNEILYTLISCIGNQMEFENNKINHIHFLNDEGEEIAISSIRLSQEYEIKTDIVI